MTFISDLYPGIVLTKPYVPEVTFEVGPGLLAQIEQGNAPTYEALTEEKLEKIIMDLYFDQGVIMIDKNQ